MLLFRNLFAVEYLSHAKVSESIPERNLKENVKIDTDGKKVFCSVISTQFFLPSFIVEKPAEHIKVYHETFYILPSEESD